MMLPILAEVSGSNFVHALGSFLIVAFCVLLLYGVSRWLIMAFVQDPAKATCIKLLNALFIVVGAVWLINFLLSLGGHGFITW